MEEAKTGCVCPVAMYCQRHNMQKTPHFHKLCQNHQGYFNMWEQCKGPGQNPNDCSSKPQESAKKEDGQPTVSEPSLWQKAKNFVPALTKQVVSGNPQASQETIDARLKICSECPFFNKEKVKCNHCGCPLLTKTKWATSSCPIGKWNEYK